MRLSLLSTGALLLFLFSAAVMASETNSSLDGARVSDILEIKQTMNLFAILVDRHQYSELSQVFTPDVVADLGTPSSNNLSGLSTITDFLTNTLGKITGQHAYSTQFVDITSSTTASVTTYFVGHFYGKGSQRGQIFQNFGTSVGQCSFDDQ